MEKMVSNCSNCPMATYAGGKYHASWYCNLDESLERRTWVNHEDEEIAHEIPAPTDCPLRNESIVITLKQ